MSSEKQMPMWSSERRYLRLQLALLCVIAAVSTRCLAQAQKQQAEERRRYALMWRFKYEPCLLAVSNRVTIGPRPNAAPELLAELIRNLGASGGDTAAAQLVRIGEPSVPILIDTLKKNNDSAVQRRAAAALGLIGDPSSTENLSDVARSPSSKIRGCGFA